MVNSPTGPTNLSSLYQFSDWTVSVSRKEISLYTYCMSITLNYTESQIEFGEMCTSLYNELKRYIFFIYAFLFFLIQFVILYIFIKYEFKGVSLLFLNGIMRGRGDLYSRLAFW